MTMLEFVGCIFVAYGPAIAMFTLTIAPYPVRIILLFSSAFFWYLALLVPCVLWLLAPEKCRWTLGLGTAVLFQELFRTILYKFLRQVHALDRSKPIVSYASGLGFGAMSGSFALVNLLADAAGPGTVGLYDFPETFLLYSSAVTCCVILLHVFWSVITFSSLDHGNYMGIFWVVASHMLVSILTLFMGKTENEGSLYMIFAITVATGVLTYITMGGTVRSLIASLSPCERDIHSS